MWSFPSFRTRPLTAIEVVVFITREPCVSHCAKIVELSDVRVMPVFEDACPNPHCGWTRLEVHFMGPPADNVVGIRIAKELRQAALDGTLYENVTVTLPLEMVHEVVDEEGIAEETIVKRRKRT